ncbi:hypothetical protein [Caulobacter sp.]|uniref:hypothetical protein n=1 Tax=Caulobacter sp. TaxID=78 RepID=UPI003BA8B896
MARETYKAFAKLTPERQQIALNLLNDLGATADEQAARRAIAYVLAEYRGPRRSWQQLADAIAALNNSLELPETEIGKKNLINFVSREVEKPSVEVLGLYALYAWECLEDEAVGKSLRDACFSEQLQALEWVKKILSTGVRPLAFPPAPVKTSPEAAEEPPEAKGITLARVREIFEERIVDYLSDDQVRQRLDWSPDTEQAGYLCFRAALGQERMVVQSFLTILSPKRSQTPFWTFAHVYRRKGHGQLRAAGGVILTTTHALYMVGGEGWIDPEHAEEERVIYNTIKPTTLTMFSIPMGALGKKETTLPGVAMTANGKDEPIVSRVALRRVNAMSHKDVLSLIPVEAFQDHLLDLATKGDRIHIVGLLEGDTSPGRQDPLSKEADRILTYINNRPTSHFLDAKDDKGDVLDEKHLLSLINKIFVNAKGGAKYRAPDESPFRFDLHQWFHALDAADIQ